MSEKHPFDLLNSPLEGTNLIEASAGTGKTYTITGVFLRLILEGNLSVAEILVVTFTQAATEELKHRIRSKLREALFVFSHEKGGDAFLQGLVAQSPDRELAVERLSRAVRDFDEAAIFTIHGFCLRILQENAFESGTLFDTKLITDQEELKRDIVEDFWRQHLYEASPLFAGYLLDKQLTPQSLSSLLTTKVARPYLKVVPEAAVPDVSSAEADYLRAFEQVAASWPSARNEVAHIISRDKALSRSQYGPAKSAALIETMDYFVESGRRAPVFPKGLEKFDAREIQKATKKDHEPPDHPFFHRFTVLVEQQFRLVSLYERTVIGLKVHLLSYGGTELALRKRARNIQSFDDLLVTLDRALKGRGGAELARAIRRKFRAALIDEFQDTDPIQYTIFRNVFDTEGGVLFFIGDPKQAIYGFRGADIFAYMAASRDVPSQYTLLKNYRSHPRLIQATNALFSGAHRPFLFKRVPFHPAEGAEERQPPVFHLDGRPVPPMTLWFLEAEKRVDPGKLLTTQQARAMIHRATAGEISRLLHLSQNGRAAVGGRPIREQDIAVLVRRNEDARLLQMELAAYGISGVLNSTSNLFDAHEALEVQRVLAAIREFGDSGLLKTALATEMLGFTAEALVSLEADEIRWEATVEKFRGLNELWQSRGFMRMFSQLLSEEGVLPRLMGFPDGERRVTNLRHLGEVLHRVSVERDLGVSGLFKWLAQQRHPEAQRMEEYQLRLESDDNAVRLITLHKSKGLEFPIVFCPFMWAGSRFSRPKDPVMFHDEADGMQLTLDLGSEDRVRHRLLAEKEALAENLRLLYVGLTRAKCCCYLVWGRINRAETSAPAYLFHQPPTWDEPNLLERLGDRFKDLDDQGVLSDLAPVIQKAEGTIELSPLPEEPGVRQDPSPAREPVLAVRDFSGKIRRDWGISSFSSLIGQRHGAEIPDHDQAAEAPGGAGPVMAPGEEGASDTIFTFPRGARAGTFLHDLLEHLDFTRKDLSSVGELVSEKLSQYGFELKWHEVITSMLDRVLSVPLEDGVTLSSVACADRLNELAFTFPLRAVSPRRLREVLAPPCGSGPLSDFPEAIGRLRFDPTRGFMRGVMDLVFRRDHRYYLLDWKSNYLGNRVADYGPEGLLETMKRDYYVLQYLLYTLALDQYLRLRLPGYTYETHFGGVFYIFLRGVDPSEGPDFGVYRDKPPLRVIERLRDELLDPG